MIKINIMLLGESGVGKTSLLLRYKMGEFAERKSNEGTIGVEFHVRKIYFEGKEVNIFIWDTGGEQRHRTLVRSYYRQGDGVLLVYDVTNPATFYTLSKWLCDLRDLNERAQILIAGNKNEDPAKKSVAVSVVKRFASQENLEYVEMSAMSGDNVEEAFLRLVKKVLIAKGILTEQIETQPDSLTTGQPTSLFSHVSLKDFLKTGAENEDKDKIRLGETPTETKTTEKGYCC